MRKTNKYTRFKHPYVTSKKLNSCLAASKRRKVLDGFPVKNWKMNKEEIEEYFSHLEIQCLICGKLYRALGNHLKIHLTTVEEYKKTYGLPKYRGLVGRSTESLMKESAIKNNSLAIVEIKKETIEEIIINAFKEKIILSEAIIMAGIARSTFFRLIKAEPELKDLLETMEQECQDYAFVSKMNKIRKHKKFKKIVCDLRSKGMSYKSIGLKYGIDTMTIRAIAKTKGQYYENI